MTTRTVPMLAQSVDLSDLPRYIKDPQWVAQLKADGHRLIVSVDEGVVSVLNRQGQPKTTGISHKLMAEFEGFTTGLWLFDGELIGSQLVLFDMIAAASLLDPLAPFSKRYHALRTLCDEVWQPDPKVVALLPVAHSTYEKLALVAKAEAEQREGIMLRHVNGVYRAGRSPHLLKCKFTREADCIITKVGVDGKENVEVSLLDPQRNRVVPVGRVTSIGKRDNGKPPALLEVWEVKFLYVVDPTAPRLYQPRLMRKRTDKEMSECLIDQLDHAYTDKDLSDKIRKEM